MAVALNQNFVAVKTELFWQAHCLAAPGHKYLSNRPFYRFLCHIPAVPINVADKDGRKNGVIGSSGAAFGRVSIEQYDVGGESDPHAAPLCCGSLSDVLVHERYDFFKRLG